MRQVYTDASSKRAALFSWGRGIATPKTSTEYLEVLLGSFVCCLELGGDAILFVTDGYVHTYLTYPQICDTTKAFH